MSQGVYSLVFCLGNDLKIPVRGKNTFFPSGYYCYVDRTKANQDLKKITEQKHKLRQLGELILQGSVINIKTFKTSKKLENKFNKELQKLSDKQMEFNEANLFFFKDCPLFRQEFHAIFEDED